MNDDTPETIPPEVPPEVPTEEPQVTIKGLQDRIGSLEEEARAAAEAHAADMNNITALQGKIASLKQVYEEYQKEVDARWDSTAGKIVVEKVEGEAVLLAKDVRTVILEVRNGIQHFETQCHFDTILQKLGIK
jgi:hypothetical protein